MPVRTSDHPEPLQRTRHVSAGSIDGERDDRGGCRDGSDDPHRADREAAVERSKADHRRDACARRGEQLSDARQGITREDRPRKHADQADGL